jgi:hypothetical protein
MESGLRPAPPIAPATRFVGGRTATRRVGRAPQITSQPIKFGSGEWTCVVGEFEGGGRNQLNLRHPPNYEQPLVVPQLGQAKQLPARCIWTPHW